MSNKIAYNNAEYNGCIVNDVGVGEFVPSNQLKELDSTLGNNEKFNDYKENKISGGHCLIVAGHNNSTESGGHSIITGDANTAKAVYSSFIGGQGNTIQYFREGFVGGLHNTFLSTEEAHGNILTGSNLYIVGDDISCNIISGIKSENSQATIGGTTFWFNHINGYDIRVSGQNVLNNFVCGNALYVSGNNIKYNFINGENNNNKTITNNIKYNYINGLNEQIAATSYCIITGYNNTVANTQSNLIVGSNNTISKNQSSIIIGQYNNSSKVNDISYNLINGDYILNEGTRNTILGESIRMYADQSIYKGLGSYKSTDPDDAYLIARKSSDRASFLNTYYPVKRVNSGAIDKMGIIEGSYNTCIGSGTILQMNSSGTPASYNALFGSYNVTIGNTNFIEGNSNMGYALTTHIEGSGNAVGATSSSSPTINDEGSTSTGSITQGSHIEGNINTVLEGVYSHIEGTAHKNVRVIYSHVEGYANKVCNIQKSHIEGEGHNINSCNNVHIEGYIITTNGVNQSHIEGQSHTVNSTLGSHIEGISNTVVNSNALHIEGQSNTATGISQGHIEGYYNTVNNGVQYAHIEGYYNTITNGSQRNHAEGSYNTITNTANDSHIEGKDNLITNGAQCSHIEGHGNKNVGYAAHASGEFTIATSRAQMVIGRANATDDSCIFIVGNGTSIPSNIPNYSATSTYAVDDLVTYQHIVYKCKTAISTPEQFTSSHWNEQNIEVIDGQEITSRSNALTLNRNGNLTVSGSITANGVVLTNANPNISDAYDNTATYVVGDYCIYNNSFFKCNTAITVAEDFDSTKWTATTIGAELLSIISRVSTLETALNGYSLADN